jgi:F-type H+-transporting ATPase subunit 8
MPQLMPFFFVNQVVYNFSLIIFIIYILTKFILPKSVRLLRVRTHVNIL